MSTIQNLKNFIRHGKQARAGEPTSGVSPVHAQPQKNHYGISEPNVPQKHHHNQHAAQPGHYSVGEPHYDNRAAQAGAAAAMQASKGQKMQDSRRDADIQAIVAEEREKAGKLPKYPGLERFVLQEKMGDGAFSNVYRARDTQTNGEVAIKVVRKFEMNQNQVCSIAIRSPTTFPYLSLHLPSLNLVLTCSSKPYQQWRP
jgi:serine/threonine-protein kinase RCK2